jgi:hypothetical protein
MQAFVSQGELTHITIARTIYLTCQTLDSLSLMLMERPVLKISLGVVLLLIVLGGFAASCTPARYILMTADDGLARAPITPQINVSNLDDWLTERERLLQVFASEIYGAAPSDPLNVELIDRQILRESDLNGTARLEDWTLSITPEDAAPLTLRLGLYWPTQTPLRAVMLVPSECGRRATLANDAFEPPTAYRPGWCGPVDSLGGPPEGMIGSLFGEHITTPPLEALADRGYVTIAWHESEISPDSAALHGDALQRLGLDPSSPDRTGTLSLWAWTISSVITALETEPELSELPTMAFGHSRRGKAVLLASARDERLDLVLSHQSGTAGAAPHNDGIGEPVGSMVENYPHWFSPQFAKYADQESEIPVNQHQLLALIAPRAVHVGGSMRDTWADPTGADLARQAAAPIWQLHGADPDTLTSSHLRRGTHGTHPEDWDAFFEAGERVISQE